MTDQQTKKIVYLLVGAKGSGKTYIGRLLEREFDIEFLKVEQRLIEHVASSESKSERLIRDGFDLEENWIGEVLQRRDEIISEATGSSTYLPEFISQLRTKYILKLIRVKCPLDVCFKRVKERNETGQFFVSDLKIRSINKLSHEVKLDWDLEIDNAGPASEPEIVTTFSNLRGLDLA